MACVVSADGLDHQSLQNMTARKKDSSSAWMAMWWRAFCVLQALSTLPCSNSFSTGSRSVVINIGTRRQRALALVLLMDRNDNLQPSRSPFFANEERPLTPAEWILQATTSSSTTTTSGSPPFPPVPPETGFVPTPEALIAKARVVLATDLGIQDPTVLADNFLWIRPLADKPLNKVDYLAAGKFFNLRRTFPDLDYRAHDFRIDVDDPLTVRCTVRLVGTMRAPLRLRNQVVAAKNQIWKGPPEAISMTLDGTTGKLVKLCSEFVMDRQVGNTNGLAGVKAASTVAGVPPNDWEVYPVPVVVSRIFGRPLEPLSEPTTFLAPFPETVMISLAKGLLYANLGSDDASLLSQDFSFLTPTIGPVSKNRFLASFAKDQFGDFRSDYQFSNYRVDPYDPYRVWVDIKLSGSGFEGPPLAYSFTFDDDGVCTRITAGAVMDPSIGNTGGLAGVEGIQYALGGGSSDVTTRPLPVALGRLRKNILSPITKIGADEFVLTPVEKNDVTTQAIAQEDAESARQRILTQAKIKIQEAEAAKKAKAMKATTSPSPAPSPPRLDPPKIEPTTVAPRIVSNPEAIEIPRGVTKSFPPRYSRSLEATSPAKGNEQQKKLEALRKKQEEVKARKAAAEETRRQKIEAQKKIDDERLRKSEKERKRQNAERQAIAKKNAAEKLRKVEEERKRALVKARVRRDEEQKTKLAERKRKEASASKPRSSAPRPSLSLSLPKPSFSIGTVKSKPSQSASLPAKSEQRTFFSLPRPSISLPRPSIPLPKKATGAPKGVPTVVAWRARSDGGIAGQVFGSPNFRDGQRFETSPISKGTIESGSVVTTKSGSRYFLSDKSVAEMKQELPKSTVLPKELLDARPRTTIQLTRQAREKERTAAIEELDKAKPDVTISLSSLIGGFGRQDESGSSSSPGNTAKMKKAAARNNTLKAPKKSTPRKPLSPPPSEPKAPASTGRPTFSLSDIFGTKSPDTKKYVQRKATPPPVPKPKAKVTKKKVVAKVKAAPMKKETTPETKMKTAPSGVPTIVNWRRNGDRSITGFIKGSKQFDDGEKVTTSPIENGVIRRGELVVTGSGSKYFLQ